MFPYILFLFFLLLAYFFGKPKLMLVAIIVFSVLRYNTGWDYAAYYDLVSNPITLEESLARFSFIWRTFFSFIFISGFPHLAIAIPNALTYIITYYALYLIFGQDKKRICDALLVYSLWPFFYLDSFSIIRQSLSISLFLLSYTLLFKRKLAVAVMIMVLNCFIHPSSIIAFTIIPLVLFRNKSAKVLLLTYGLIFYFSFGIVPVILSSINIPGLSDLAGYIDMTDSYGSKLIFLQTLILLYFILCLRHTTPNSLSRLNCLIIILTFFLEISLYLIDVGSFAARILKYFEIILMLEFLYSCDYISIKGLRPFYAFSLVGLFIVYLFLINTQAGLSNASSPYVPYTFIWSN